MTAQERIDGLVSITDEGMLEVVLESIVKDLSRDGFDKEDIEEFLINKVKSKTSVLED